MWRDSFKLSCAGEKEKTKEEDKTLFIYKKKKSDDEALIYTYILIVLTYSVQCEQWNSNDESTIDKHKHISNVYFNTVNMMNCIK